MDPVHDKALRGEEAKIIRIVHVVSSLEIGGTQELLLDLIPRMDKTQFDNIICTVSWKGLLAKEAEAKGIEVYDLAKGNRQDIRAVFRLAAFARQRRVDIIQGYNFSGNFWGGLGSKLSRVPVFLVTWHAPYTDLPSYKKAISRMLSRLSKRIIVINEDIWKLWVDTYGFPAKKVALIDEGIDLDVYSGHVDRQAIAEELGLDPNRPVIGTIGRLDPQKGHSYLLEAFVSVLSACPQAQLLIIGDGKLRSQLEEQARNLNIEGNVRFVGVRRDLVKIYALLDVFVMSSLWEGLPLVVLKAMAAKKPMVLTQVGGIPEIVQHNRTGFLVPPANPTALAEGIIWMLENPEAAQRLGNQAYKVVRDRFDIEKMVERYQTLYREVLSDRSRDYK